MKGLVWAHVSLITLNFLYALSYFVIKRVAPDFLGASGFVWLRAAGALLLYWLVDAFLPKEQIEKGDQKKFLIAGIFGVVCNQLSFFHGMTYTSPNHSAIIMTTTPLVVLPISYLLLKDRVTKNQLIGVLIGLVGAITVILQNSVTKEAPNPILGDLLIFSNAVNFSIFLVYSKPLMAKYKPFTVLKWVFLYGVIILTPIGFYDITTATWDFPWEIWRSILYVIIGITFLTFLLNLYAIKRVSPNVSTSYIFFQPMMAGILSYFITGDVFTAFEFGASLLIFLGVYFVAIKKS